MYEQLSHIIPLKFFLYNYPAFNLQLNMHLNILLGDCPEDEKSRILEDLRNGLCMQKVRLYEEFRRYARSRPLIRQVPCGLGG